jgi:hypothetical protein
MSKGRSLRLFLADGSPTGIITAEIMNWTGHVISAPRAKLAELLQRGEVGRTGVYCLTGTDPDGGLKPLVYLGESDNVGRRLVEHNGDKDRDFWERTVCIISKDHNLTKAHVRYLESRLIAIIKESGRANLTNKREPESVLLPGADTSDMEFFIEQIQIVMPVLGHEFLRPTPKLSSVHPSEALPFSPSPQESLTYELTTKKIPGAHAEALEIDGDFVVLAGSLARADSPQSTNQYRKIRDMLKADAVLVPEGPLYRFAKDAAFKSPSAASSVILDRNDNGRTSWTLKGTNKSYADVQNEQISAIASKGDGE